MNTTEHELDWTSKGAWGVVGKMHSTDVIVGDDSYYFVVNQPRKGYWVARGWKNGESCLHRDGNTLTRMKGLVADVVAGLRAEAVRQQAQNIEENPQDEASLANAVLADAEAAEDPECWCAWVDIGVGMQRAAEIVGCPEHCPYVDEDVCTACNSVDCTPDCVSWTAPDVPAKAASDRLLDMASLAAVPRSSFQAFRYRLPCNCPTPTHRMSCGTGATPKVVQS